MRDTVALSRTRSLNSAAIFCGDLLGAGGEVVLLGAADHVEHAIQPAGGLHVAHRVQHRHASGSAPHVTRAMIAIRARAVEVAPTDRSQPSSVWESSFSARGASHGWARSMSRAMRSNCQRMRPMSSQSDQRQLRDGPLVGAHLAAPPDQVGAVVEGRDGGAAQLGGQGQHRVLGRPDERAAQIDRHTGERGGARASADPVAALEDDRLEPVSHQFARRRQARESCADHHHVVAHPDSVAYRRWQPLSYKVSGPSSRACASRPTPGCLRWRPRWPRPPSA